MWQSLVFSILFLHACATSESAHLKQLKINYPYGILGDDFGLLKEDDLAINTCKVTEPEPFSAESTAYPYWQCFRTEEVIFECSSSGYDLIEKMTPAILAIVSKGKKGNQEYLSRRAIDMKICKSIEKDWKKAIAGEKHVCLSGPYGGPSENGNFWMFDKFKTQRGCISYFEGDCDLPYQLKNGCKLKTVTPHNSMIAAQPTPE